MVLTFVVHDETTDSGYREKRIECETLEIALDTMSTYSRIATGTFYLDKVDGTRKQSYMIMGCVL